MPLPKIIKKQKDFRDKLDDNLVLWLRFNEGAGTTAYDSSRQFNHGTITDATYVDGKVGEYALSLDGDNDIVQLSDEEFKIPNGGKVSYCFWIKWTGGTGNRMIFSKYNGTANGHFEIWMEINDKLSALWRSGATNNPVISTFSLVQDTWYHIVATFDKETGASILYIDGDLDNSETQATDFVNNNANLRIGNRSSDGSRDFTGIIDDVRIYNRGFSTTEVSHLYTLVGGS